MIIEINGLYKLRVNILKKYFNCISVINFLIAYHNWENRKYLILLKKNVLEFSISSLKRRK